MKASGKALGTAGALGIALLFTALVFLPSAMIVFAGMVPTFAAALGASRHRALKAFTIGSLNFAGCVPYLAELWSNGQTLGHATALIVDPRTLIVIYCAAGVGYLVDWGVGSIVSLVIMQRMRARLQHIQNRQEALAERWGAGVTGEPSMDIAASADTKRKIGEQTS